MVSTRISPWMLSAGPDLDAAVYAVLPPRRDGSAWERLPFSTDERAAWDLFDEYRSWDNVYSVSIAAPYWDGYPRTYHDYWTAFYTLEWLPSDQRDGDRDDHYYTGTTMPLAVCYTALILAQAHSQGKKP